MARLRIKTQHTRLTISTRHAIRVRPFPISCTERHTCHEHTSEARLGRRALLRRGASIWHVHGHHPGVSPPPEREPDGHWLGERCRVCLVAEIFLGARGGPLGRQEYVDLGLPSLAGDSAAG